MRAALAVFLLLTACASSTAVAPPSSASLSAQSAPAPSSQSAIAAQSAQSAGSASAAAPELLVLGRLHTLDPAAPRAEAALLRSGRIACLGTRARCEPLATPGAERLELGPGSATPGLTDAHAHLLKLGRALTFVRCNGLSAEECAARVAERARTVPAGAWIRGRGWDQNRWPGRAFPDSTLLDRAAPDNPVYLLRVDGHAAWANRRALDLAGLSAATPDPAGGRIVRSASGAPSGVVIDNAADLVEASMPEPIEAQMEEQLLRGMQAAAAAGLTEVHDPGESPRALEILRRLAAQGRLPIRVYSMIDGSLPLPELDAQLSLWKRTPEVGLLTVRAVKLYADGALGSRGALLSQPYSDDPGNSGLAVTPGVELRARILRVAAAGFQPAVHAIGDRASKETLEDFAQVDRALRPRVEHLQILLPEDVHLLTESGAIASMQPVHATSDGPWAERRLGHGTDRQRGAYAWRQALTAGATLACGSDAPAEDIDPRQGLYAAETRRWPKSAEEPAAPPEGWMPEQRLDRLAALRCFTKGAALAAFAEQRRGTLHEGGDADLTLWGSDILALPAEQLLAAPLRGTIVNGLLQH